MTKEKIQAISKITLANSAILCTLTSCVSSLIEQVAPTFPEKDEAIALLKDLQVVQAQIRDLLSALDLAQKEIDAPDA
jgi:hypothetical protein